MWFLLRRLGTRLSWFTTAFQSSRRWSRVSGDSSSSSSSNNNILRASVSSPLLFATAAIPLAMAAAYSSTVVKCDGLGPAPDEAHARPHHASSKNGVPTKFRNPYPSAGGGSGPLTMFVKAIRALLHGEKITRPDPTPPTVPVREPSFLPTRHASDGSDHKLRATWLGHACYYVEFPSGLRVLFDPVFEDRCSPFAALGPRRYTPPPCAVADLPFVDAVVISHSHYDHLSVHTVEDVRRRHPHAHFFVGLGLAPWFRAAGIDRVTELDWWEDAEMTLTPASQRRDEQEQEEGKAARAGSASSTSTSTLLAASDGDVITARFSCLPSQHTSSRTGFDLDRTLWCSWGVTSARGPLPPRAASPSSSPRGPDDKTTTATTVHPTTRSVYFGGDTGYRAVPFSAAGDPDAIDRLPACPQFAQIGAHRGPFDLGLIPIGAYSPRPVFSHVHADPSDAVEIFVATRCRRAMGIHWGTWVLTSEEVLEPPAKLREALRRKGIAETGVFDVCDIGESREF